MSVLASVDPRSLLSISPSGKYVALASSQGLPRLFTVGPPVREQTIDTRTDKELTSRASEGVAAMAFHPSQPLLVLALRSGGSLLVDLANGPRATLAHAESRFTALALSSGGEVVVMATDDRRVMMERTPTASADPLAAGHIAVDFEIRALAAGPRGWPLVVAGEDRVMVFARSPSPHGAQRDPADVQEPDRPQSWFSRLLRISRPAAPVEAAPPQSELPLGPLQARGPWPIPTDARPELALIEDDNMVAVLADGRLLLLHLDSGLDLLREEDGLGRHRVHAALGAPRNLALLWGENQRQLMVHTFINRTSEAKGVPAPA